MLMLMPSFMSHIPFHSVLIPILTRSYHPFVHDFPIFFSSSLQSTSSASLLSSAGLGWIGCPGDSGLVGVDSLQLHTKLIRRIVVIPALLPQVRRAAGRLC